MKHCCRNTFVAALIGAGIAAASSAAYAESGIAIELKNGSDWEIHHVYFSPVSQDDWGSDHLGKEILEKGDKLELSNISSGKYDIKIVDEDGDECVVSDVSVNADEAVEIDNASLIGCQVETEESGEG